MHFSYVDFEAHLPFLVADWVSNLLKKLVFQSFCSAWLLEMLSSFGFCSFLIVIEITQANSDASSESGFCSASDLVHGLFHFIAGRFAGLFLGFQ